MKVSNLYISQIKRKCGIEVGENYNLPKTEHLNAVDDEAQEELERAAHNYELEESDSTVLCIDYALNGIGSNSCGPVVSDAYRF